MPSFSLQGHEKRIAQLPKLLNRVVKKFDTPEEQDLVLLSSIVTYGSLMPQVTVNYANRTNYLALMLVIILPPASGKGSISQVRKLLRYVDQFHLEEYKQQLDQYRFQKQLNSSTSKAKAIEGQNFKEEPKLVQIAVPGNISSAKLIEQLAVNGDANMLLIFETEADAFGMNASKGEYASMNSTILRQAFHHEVVSQMRKTNSELLVAHTPKLCVVLAGTENQIPRIFHSAGDGLMSRFLVAYRSVSSAWKDIKPCVTCPSLDDFFDQEARRAFELWKHFKEKKCEVRFTDSQWDVINAFGIEKLSVAQHFVGELAGSIAKRHANMIVRIAAILTMLRTYELNINDNVAYCADVDFDIALTLITQSFTESIQLYKLLPGDQDNKMPAYKSQFLEHLPDKFTIEEVNTLSNSMKLAKRTVTRWLKQFVEGGLLQRVGIGSYEKQQLASVALALANELHEENLENNAMNATSATYSNKSQNI